MNSFIVRSENGTRIKLALLGCICLFVVAAHSLLEATARFAEQRLDAYLWKEEDYLRLFLARQSQRAWPPPAVDFGRSEAREALLPEELGRALPGLEPYQNALSQGTLEDALVVLEYIERAYGRSAVPDILLFGITTRFIADIRDESSPLFAGINKYSRQFRLDEAEHPPRLIPRSTLDSYQAAFALLGRQPVRYQSALFAVAAAAAMQVRPNLEADPRFWRHVRAAKYIRGRIAPMEASKKWLVESRFWDMIHSWNPERDRVTRALRRLRDFRSRHGIQLYMVNLPELSWNRVLYQPGRYEAYLDIVRLALGDTPFLDLRTFLPDDEFYDSSHPTWDGGMRVSKRVGAFIAERLQHEASPRVDQ